MEINPSLTERRPHGSLRPDPRNARVHSERNIEAIAQSLRDHGQQRPLVVAPDGTIIAGNGTWVAAGRLGATEVAVVVYRGPSAKRFAVADNRTAELATWDDSVLARILQEIQAEGGLAQVGFSDDELSRILAESEAPTEFEDVGEEVETNHECPRCHYRWSE